MTVQLDGLIAVLLDHSARIDERDDAVMDLGEYDAALPVLIEAARNLNEDGIVAASLGVAIGEIWTRVAGFDPKLIENLHPRARFELRQRFSDR